MNRHSHNQVAQFFKQIFYRGVPLMWRWITERAVPGSAQRFPGCPVNPPILHTERTAANYFGGASTDALKTGLKVSVSEFSGDGVDCLRDGP